MGPILNHCGSIFGEAWVAPGISPERCFSCLLAKLRQEQRSGTARSGWRKEPGSGPRVSLDGFGHASVGGVREAGRVGQRGPETGAGLHHVAGAALPNPGEGGVQTEAGAMA